MGNVHDPGFTRWQAPELQSPLHTGSVEGLKMADVFSFGMVAMEVFTGKVPFEEFIVRGRLVSHIDKGDRPKKPTEAEAEALGLTDEMWDLLGGCWEGDASRRFSMESVVKQLDEIVGRESW